MAALKKAERGTTASSSIHQRLSIDTTTRSTMVARRADKSCGGGGVSKTFALLSALLLVLAPLAAAEFNPTKCSACEAVASELRRRLDGERRSAPLDLRNRIGPSSGDRRGRVIEWRRSEQRAVELLEGLCARMAADHRIVPLDEDDKRQDGAKVWRRWRGRGAAEGLGAPPSGDSDPAREAEVKALAAGCGMLLEEVEEDLVARLREGEVEETDEGEDGPRPQALDAARVLCRDLTRRCDGKEAHEAARAAAAAAAAKAAAEASEGGAAPAAAPTGAESDDDDDEGGAGEAAAAAAAAAGARDGTEL